MGTDTVGMCVDDMNCLRAPIVPTESTTFSILVSGVGSDPNVLLGCCGIDLDPSVACGGTTNAINSFTAANHNPPKMLGIDCAHQNITVSALVNGAVSLSLIRNVDHPATGLLFEAVVLSKPTNVSSPTVIPCKLPYGNFPASHTIDVVNSCNPPSVCVDEVAVERPAWSSLFKSLPHKTGAFTSQKFFAQVIDKISMLPPKVVHDAGNQWSDHLVGFFLDSASTYSVVHEHCRRAWKMRGTIHVQVINSFFYFKFGNNEDKLISLETSPLIIEGQPFIVTPWSVSIDKAIE